MSATTAASSTSTVHRVLHATLGVLTVVAVTAIGLLLYDRFGAPRPTEFATVSLQSVLEIKEAQFTELLMSPALSDTERTSAMKVVEELGPQLERAIDELRRECRCVLLVREAVIGRGERDLTPALLAKLGVADVDIEALRARVLQLTSGASTSGGPGSGRAVAESRK